MQVFLGTLRESEVERINDRISQAVMETCLAMTIFRDEFNVEFVAMFTILTFIKVFHWLIQDRVDFIETTPTVSRWHHVRIISFMLVLLVRPHQLEWPPSSSFPGLGGHPDCGLAEAPKALALVVLICLAEEAAHAVERMQRLWASCFKKSAGWSQLVQIVLEN